MKWMRVESGLGENMVQFVFVYSALSVYWQYMTKIAHFISSEIFHFAAAVHGKKKDNIPVSHVACFFFFYQLFSTLMYWMSSVL